MRVLIATATVGGGHLAAAAAVEEAWLNLRPGDVVERVDLTAFSTALSRKVHTEGYLRVVEHAPELWGMVFEKTDHPAVARTLNRLKRLFPIASRIRFRRHVERFRPDVVLCTHYLGLEVLGQIKSRRPGGSEDRRPCVVSIVTDFEAHALWMDDAVDLYCVAAEETRARLIARGAPEDRVVATGIPIASRFGRPVDPKSVRRRMGLRDDLPTLLVLSGGFGLGPVAEILAALDAVPTPLQTVVVTGRNQDMRQRVAAVDRAHPTHVLGFASNMHELMGVADLVITKPGGLTTSEAMAMGKPIFVINPIPGQEAANSDFLLEHGAAAKANRVEDLPFRIGQLLGGRKLAAMGKAAKAVGRPDAAQAVCRQTLARVRSADDREAAS